MVFKNFFYGAIIDKVDVVKNRGFAGDFFDIFKCGSFAVDEIVDNDDFVAAV